VDDVVFHEKNFTIKTGNARYNATICAGSFGKRSNLDVKFKRDFVRLPARGLNNYLGIKYHIRYDHPKDLIALHNFKNGYCGISKVEDDKYCLCYLTSADNLQASNNDIHKMEQNILSANPHLKKIFSECEMLWKEPVTISQISFEKKNLIQDHVLMIGDSAGMITPLCGNGMSMALHASKIAAEQMKNFLSGKLSRDEMERIYSTQWNELFATRLKMGRMLQKLMLNKSLTNFTISIGKIFPSIIRSLIKQTHGSPY